MIPVLNSYGVQCKALILKTNSMPLFTAQLRASRHVTCLCLPQKRLLEKEEYYASVLERQSGLLPPLPWSKCAAFSIQTGLLFCCEAPEVSCGQQYLYFFE